MLHALDEETLLFAGRLIRAMQNPDLNMTDQDVAFFRAAVSARNFKAADARLRRKLMRVAHEGTT